MEKEKALVTVSGGALMESEVITEALAFAQEGFGGLPIALPKGYDVARAVKNLCFALPNVYNIEKATKESIMQAVHDYITQGLDIRKHQCALIVYLDKDSNGKYTGTGRLDVQPEYFGNVYQALQLNPNIKEISRGTMIYAGEKLSVWCDKFGRTHVKHEPDFSCWSEKNIVGAYAVVTYKDGTTDTELMTLEEIKKAWAQSRNGDKVHKQFPVEMCKKTVLNRLCKKLINTTNDGAIVGNNDLRQPPDDAVPVDFAEVEDYAEPEEIAEDESEPIPKIVAPPPAEETPQAQGNPDDEDYKITIPYGDYKDNYGDRATGVYIKGTRMIEVYPNRKKKAKQKPDEVPPPDEAPEFLR